MYDNHIFLMMMTYIINDYSSVDNINADDFHEFR